MNHSSQDQQTFSPLRKLLWPIHSFELKKFLPLSLIMFCVIFNYTLLHDVKDVLVVQNIGAYGIPYVKGIAVAFFAVMFVLAYVKLSNLISRERLFYVITCFFMSYYCLFGFLLYPNSHLLQPDPSWVEATQDAFPWAAGLIALYGKWVYVSYYVMAELWGSAMITLLFWQLANHVVKFEESKRFYGLFAVIGNTALIFSGRVTHYFSIGIQKYFQNEQDTWAYSLYFLTLIVILMCLVCMALHYWLYREVLTDKRYFDMDKENEAIHKQKSQKHQPTIVESFKLIMASRELLSIAVLLMSFGITMVFLEVQLKYQLQVHYAGNPAGLGGFLGQFSSLMGLVSLVFGWLIGSNILRHFSWKASALLTPLIMTGAGAIFFIYIIGVQYIELFQILSGKCFLPLGVLLGASIIMLSKTAKYTLFDPTKEMAYIPLDPDLKQKGKAAVDVIGGRLGKASGGYIQMIFFSLLATRDVLAIAPYVFFIFILIGGMWIVAVKYLSRLLKKSEDLAQ